MATLTKHNDEYEDIVRFSPGRLHTLRCKMCGNVLNSHWKYKTCASCRDDVLALRKLKAKEKTKNSPGLIGLLKARIASALRRELGNKKYAGDLTMSFLLELHDRQNGKCALSGRSLSLGSIELNKFDPNVISLDRIDSTKGYTKGNVQFVTYCANMAKWKLTQEDFIGLCRDVVKQADQKSMQI
jgi:hypothetical protein